MASPPYSATSPPGPAPLALPKQRPSLALPGGATKSRKPSIASNASSAHPLRQTSFPPTGSLEAQHAAAQYSPTEEGGFEDDLSDSEIVSALSGPAGPGEEGPAGKKRKRGGGKTGRPRKKRGSESLVNGEDGTPARGAKGGGGGDNAEDDDEAEEEETDARGGRVPAYEGIQMSDADFAAEQNTHKMFRDHMMGLDALPLASPARAGLTHSDFANRYDIWKSSKLRGQEVKKLVNQTVGQSVPPPVVLAVQAYTKLFAGMIVEGARGVQREWGAVEGERADGGRNGAWERLRRSYVESVGEGDEGEEGREEKVTDRKGKEDEAVVKNEPSSPSTRPDSRGGGRPSTQLNGTTQTSSQSTLDSPLHPGGASALQTSIQECDRGPLLPDHLREALRRYKKGARGGGAGFTGYSLEGKTGTAARMGGRRLFR